MRDIILYTTEDGRSQIQLRTENQTVWLTQLEMAELFDATKQNISLHLKNLFEDGELDEGAVVKESLTTAADGKRYSTLLYNLDAILAVGYRVRSPRGGQYRHGGCLLADWSEDCERKTSWSRRSCKPIRLNEISALRGHQSWKPFVLFKP